MSAGPESHEIPPPVPAASTEPGPPAVSASESQAQPAPEPEPATAGPTGSPDGLKRYSKPTISRHGNLRMMTQLE